MARLSSPRPADREAAVARLVLLGPRAVPAVLAALPGPGPELRLCVLDLLERIPDPRALPEVVALCRDRDDSVARRALSLLPRFAEAKAATAAARILTGGPADRRTAAVQALCGLHARGVLEALEPLLDAILDETEGETLRLEALASLDAVDPKTAATLRERLARGPLPLIRSQTDPARSALPEPAGLAALLRRLENPRLGAEEATGIQGALEAAGAAALPAVHAALDRATEPRPLCVLADVVAHLRSPTSIPVLSRVLNRLGSPARSAAAGGGLAEATSRLHKALAALNSRIALFDLRERLLAAPAAAASLLEAAERIGDASLLPALARLHAEREALREPVARAFAAIVMREELRPRSAALRGLKPEDREALQPLWAALPGGYSRTLPVMGTKRTGRTRRSS